jgi:hypothetical protein
MISVEAKNVTNTVMSRHTEENTNIHTTILDLGTSWRGQLHSPADTPLGETSTAVIDYQAGWVSERRKICFCW